MPISTTLAQIFEPPLPGVGSTPWIETWITGSGYLGAGVAIALGAIAYYALAKAERARLGLIAGLALALVGFGVLIVGRTVTTTRELLRERTAALIDAAATADRQALTGLLHPDVRVRTRFGSGQGRDQVIALSQRASGFINAQSVKRSAVDPRGSQVARTMVTLRVDADSLPRLSQWSFDWQRQTADAPWVVVNIEPIWIQGIDNPAGSP